MSATLIVAAAILAVSFVVYDSDRSQLDPRNVAHLRLLLLLISAAGIGAAAALAALFSGRAVAPLRRLAASIERVDHLLANVEELPRQQRNLLANAAEELGTAIAILRANFEQLTHPCTLDAHDRAELLSNADRQLRSMTWLVDELLRA